MIDKLGAATEWADLVTAAAPILPVGSLMRGAAEAVGPTVKALRDLVTLSWIKREWHHWHSIESRPLVCMVRRHGVRLTRVKHNNDELVVYQIGCHRVALGDRTWSEMRASGTEDEIASELCGLLDLTDDSTPIRLSRDGDEWTAEVEGAVTSLMGTHVDALSRVLAAELKHGVRSILLVGSAGMGKSTAARQLAKLSDGPVIVLDSTAAKSAAAWTVAANWRPGAVIIEDLDHAIDSDKSAANLILGQLERIRLATRLVLMTANTMPSLAPTDDGQDPLTRTGRVDHVIVLDKLDVGLASRLGAELPDDLLSTSITRGFSASDLQELGIRWSAHPGRRAAIRAHVIDGSGTPRQVLDECMEIQTRNAAR